MSWNNLCNCFNTLSVRAVHDAYGAHVRLDTATGDAVACDVPELIQRLRNAERRHHWHHTHWGKSNAHGHLRDRRALLFLLSINAAENSRQRRRQMEHGNAGLGLLGRLLGINTTHQLVHQVANVHNVHARTRQRDARTRDIEERELIVVSRELAGGTRQQRKQRDSEQG